MDMAIERIAYLIEHERLAALLVAVVNIGGAESDRAKVLAEKLCLVRDEIAALGVTPPWIAGEIENIFHELRWSNE